MPPVAVRTARRAAGTSGLAVAVLCATSVLAWPGHGVFTSLVVAPVDRVAFSAEVARDVFAEPAACAKPARVLAHGDSTGLFYLDPVTWYRAVAWDGLTGSAAERVVNACLGLQPALTGRTWLGESPPRVGPTGLSESWNVDLAGMVDDDVFGATSGRFLQHTEIHDPHGLARIVYVHRSPDARQYAVHLYLLN